MSPGKEGVLRATGPLTPNAALWDFHHSAFSILVVGWFFDGCPLLIFLLVFRVACICFGVVLLLLCVFLIYLIEVICVELIWLGHILH